MSSKKKKKGFARLLKLVVMEWKMVMKDGNEIKDVIWLFLSERIFKSAYLISTLQGFIGAV